MSAPKLKRRIGFTIDTQGRLRTTARGGKWTPDLVREARWLYLTVLAGECPEVLKSLSRLQYSDIAALDAWLASWGLVSADSADDWCREHAMATRRNWARYQPRPLYWFDREDLGGTLYDDTEPPEARPLKHIDHFVWLAQHQSGRPGQRRLPAGAYARPSQR